MLLGKTYSFRRHGGSHPNRNGLYFAGAARSLLASTNDCQHLIYCIRVRCISATEVRKSVTKGNHLRSKTFVCFPSSFIIAIFIQIPIGRPASRIGIAAGAFNVNIVAFTAGFSASSSVCVCMHSPVSPPAVEHSINCRRRNLRLGSFLPLPMLHY